MKDRNGGGGGGQHLDVSLLGVHQCMVGKLPGHRVYQRLAVRPEGVFQMNLFQPEERQVSCLHNANEKSEKS